MTQTQPIFDPNLTQNRPKTWKNWETRKIQAMKNFTNLVGFSDSKLGYRVAKENLEFIDGKIISKEKISLTVTNL